MELNPTVEAAPAIGTMRVKQVIFLALAAAFLTTMVDSSVFRKPFGLFLLYAGLSILFEKKKNSKKETS